MAIMKSSYLAIGSNISLFEKRHHQYNNQRRRGEENRQWLMAGGNKLKEKLHQWRNNNESINGVSMASGVMA
jgi:hypothetical protein